MQSRCMGASLGPSVFLGRISYRCCQPNNVVLASRSIPCYISLHSHFKRDTHSDEKTCHLIKNGCYRLSLLARSSWSPKATMEKSSLAAWEGHRAFEETAKAVAPINCASWCRISHYRQDMNSRVSDVAFTSARGLRETKRQVLLHSDEP